MFTYLVIRCLGLGEWEAVSTGAGVLSFADELSAWLEASLLGRLDDRHEYSVRQLRVA